MNIILIITLREVLTLLKKPSFWITAVAGPLVAGAIIFGYGYLNREIGAQATPGLSVSGGKPAGYIDQAGVVRDVPAVLRSRLRSFADEAAASAALRAGTIDS